MKIRAKVTLFTSFFLVLVVLVITYYSVQNIQQQGEVRLQNFKAAAIGDIKNHLKDLVDVAYETIDKNYRNLSDIGFLSKYYERRLKDILNTSETIINRYRSQADSGKISLAEAQKRAMNEIRALRFDNGTGYIWINDLSQPYPKMVMHPTIPALEGKVLNDRKYNNAQGVGKNLFRAFVDVTRNSPDGYVDYLWPKPTAQGLSEEVPKLSYVRRYQDWGWIVGTGIYIDDSYQEIQQVIKESIRQMRYANGTGYFWINDNALPYPTMVMHPTVPALEGQVLDDNKFNNALGMRKNLFTAFAEITASEGEGFVDYLWPKPTPEGLTEETEKMSFVRLHKPTGWIIGTGVYLDSIDKIVAEKRRQIEQQIFDLIKGNLIISSIFIAIAVVLSFLFSGTIAQPISRLTGIAERISKGKGFDVTIDEINRSDEIGELAKSIDRLKTSVKIMIDRMSKTKGR